MKQKIVIHVPTHHEKQKYQAMKIAVAIKGVNSVRLPEDQNDRLEVIGEGVDSVSLAKSLRKKFRFADIISIDEVKAEEESTDPNDVEQIISPYPPPPYPHYVHYESRVVYDPPPNCSIL